ncbi:MAG: hypothetical protein AAB575_00115 [Patescibacteria group bacterium]
MSEEKKEKWSPVCKECIGEFKHSLSSGLIALGTLIAMTLLGFVGIYAIADVEFLAVSFLIILLIFLSVSIYSFAIRNVIGKAYFAFKDKQARLHIHESMPQFSVEKFTYFSASLITDKNSTFDDMAITGPILKFFLGSWFRKNEIFGVTNGLKDCYPCSIKELNISEFSSNLNDTVITLKFTDGNMSLQTPWLELANALRIIEITEPSVLWQFIDEQEKHFVYMDSYKLETMLHKRDRDLLNRRTVEAMALIVFIRNSIDLITAWRGVENSKVGMGARCFLETTLEAINKHSTPSMLTQSSDEFIGKVREEIALKSETNQILRRFIQSDERYKSQTGSPPIATVSGT